MAKLHDLFTQARRARSSSGMGFLGKSRAESKAHAAAIVVEFPTVSSGSAEAALKAGADGLLFQWDGKDSAALSALKQEVDAARSYQEDIVLGLHLAGNGESLNGEAITSIKEQGFNYITLPLNAPAHLLAQESKDVEKVVILPVQNIMSPLRSGDVSPYFTIRNLSGLDGIAAILLDFDIEKPFGSLSIEDILHYNTVRGSVQHPAFIRVGGRLNENDTRTLKALNVQGVVLEADKSLETTQEQVKALRALLEKLHEEKGDSSSPFSLQR
ncbi:hypothetical protein [Ktedonobacter racemifer]|uniref:Uncharacterized protein n=1 Tax=Ktedonobacter racemifer DSM 44963 TaxID=485913 RepID=D6TJW1_KTERA|nr:hypothetical protein [Ktedonobacter racemifer]EFH89718.1 hypothetical protein Krac_11284 [Ktedonobacter racemifer DSM 44963]